MINLPEDFKIRMRDFLLEQYDDFIASYEECSEKSLRINAVKNPEEILPFAALDNNSFRVVSKAEIPDCARVQWENKGIYYRDISENEENTGKDSISLISPGKSPLHAAGAYYIQEASAMLPVTLLNIKEDERPLKILDLCASPGGKSTQIADLLKGRGILVSNEITSQRAKILSENIERMGIPNALVISEDPVKLAPRFNHFFDRILVDAPCSGEGMFRKNPKACDEWSTDNVMMCADRQAYILDCAARMLDFSGKIVYSTCTFSPEEDEKGIDSFLNRHPEFQRAGEDIKIYPHQERGEGHFAAVLEYKEKGSISNSNGSKKKKKKGVDKNQIGILLDFLRNTFETCELLNYIGKDTTLDEETESRLMMFGDKMYLNPEYMPDIDGLTVLRPGLHLGNIIKGRFEPAHAFALAVKIKEAKHSVNYGQDSAEINGYLRGMTLNYEGENGWYIVAVEGISLGWAKNANNILKNHYPKGLRVLGG